MTQYQATINLPDDKAAIFTGDLEVDFTNTGFLRIIQYFADDDAGPSSRMVFAAAPGMWYNVTVKKINGIPVENKP